MKSASVTIRLDPKLQRELSRLSRQLGRSRSDLVRDALRRPAFKRLELEEGSLCVVRKDR
jgi:predicted transcriptional regulator